MSSVSRASNRHSAVTFWAGLVAVAVGVFIAGDAIAIDGNYASPYASQYDSRSTAVSIPNETWIGLFLLLANALLAGFYALRYRRRQRLLAD